MVWGRGREREREGGRERGREREREGERGREREREGEKENCELIFFRFNFLN